MKSEIVDPEAPIRKEVLTRTVGDDGKEIVTLPDADLATVRARFIPSGDVCDWADYEMRGIALLQAGRVYGRVFGELVEWGWQYMRPTTRWNDEEIRTRTRWVAFCALTFGCDKATVWRAWGVATVGIDVPEDVPPSLVTEITSGTGDNAEAERVLTLAIERGWSAHDVREIKWLHEQGLLPGDAWILPRLYMKGRNLMIDLGDGPACCATLQPFGDLAVIGTVLLQRRARIGRDEIDGKRVDKATDGAITPARDGAQADHEKRRE